MNRGYKDELWEIISMTACSSCREDCIVTGTERHEFRPWICGRCRKEHRPAPSMPRLPFNPKKSAFAPYVHLGPAVLDEDAYWGIYDLQARLTDEEELALLDLMLAEPVDCYGGLSKEDKERFVFLTKDHLHFDTCTCHDTTYLLPLGTELRDNLCHLFWEEVHAEE